MVTFRRFNLLDSFGWLDDLDLVLCRNVLIYFDRAAKESVLERMAETLSPDGVLLLGEAESVHPFASLYQELPGGSGSMRVQGPGDSPDTVFRRCTWEGSKKQGALRPEQVSLGKMTCVRTAIDIARQARTILGANGVTLEYPVIRHANNLEAVLTYEGTQEIHELAIGEAITGLSAYR